MRKINYAECVYDEMEIGAVNSILENSRLSLMDGKAVRNFEKLIPAQFGKQKGLMVNSGSSANLLAMAALNLPKGSHVVTPALTFSTTVAPIVQLGLKPKFVDIEIQTLQLDPGLLLSALDERTSAVLVPNLIGNVANWREIHRIVKNYNSDIVLFEDSADTIGYTVDGVLGNKYSDIVTTSFYASHIITGAGFGGFVSMNSDELFDRARLLRGWGRRSALFGENEDIASRFSVELDGLGYDAKYIFDEMGYNFLPSEISAAFATVQLQKLSQNISTRRKNFSRLKSLIDENLGGIFYTFSEYQGVKTPWLAFPLLIKGSEYNRSELQIQLERSNVQTRTIFTGNILRQPVAKKYGLSDDMLMRNSDDVMGKGILLGCHHGLSAQDTDELYARLEDTVKNMGWIN